MAGEYIFADISGVEPYRDKFPPGHRGYVVLHEGDKWATLFSPVLLRSFKIKIDDYDDLDAEDIEVSREGLAARIREALDVAKKYNMLHSGRDAARALKLLEGET